MNNINVGACAIRSNRGFYWPTTPFLIHEEEKKRRSMRSPRRVRNSDEEHCNHQASIESSRSNAHLRREQFQKGYSKSQESSSNNNAALLRREQFRKTSSKSQDSYFSSNKTKSKTTCCGDSSSTSESTRASKDLASTYSPSTLRRVCNALSLQRLTINKSHKSSATNNKTDSPNKRLQRQQNVSETINSKSFDTVNKNVSSSSLPQPLRKISKSFIRRKNNAQEHVAT